MSSKKIYLIRHGQTDYNKQGIVQGSGVDASLNELGWRQAGAFYAMYQGVSFDKVYTSVLKRSQESVKKFIDRGIPHEALPGLNEINWGTREGQRITPEEDAYYHDILDQWRKGNTGLPIEGGESPEDVTQRLIPAMDHIMAQEHEKIILICMHGRSMRILLCYLLQYPLYSMDFFEHTNLGLYLLNYHEGVYTMELMNDTTHMDSL